MQWSIEDRPHKLSDMVGTDKVKSYFYNIKKEKKDFPQGIIFQGFTGMGKTCAAKIVAQMIVCDNPKENGDPCCECPHCKAIIDEKYNKSVMQIDGGNSSKDEIVNTINDFLATPSMMGKPKVVMVEEAQELSSAAQKSLLKLLEIPRKNTHIILTTMTGNGGKRLPSAILNRCIRFNFAAATNKEMVSYLSKILKGKPDVMKEMPDLTQEEFFKFLESIAMNSAGSYRQGLQLLEQCIDTGVYTSKDIAKEFGITDEAGFYEIMLDMLNGNISKESFETLCDGDANKLNSVFSLSYKVISDAECYRLFGKVPNVDEDNEFFMRQAKEISSHPNFPYMRDIYYEFAQYEKLMPSNIRMLVCRVYDKCKNHSTGTKPIREATSSKETKTSTPSFNTMEEVKREISIEAETDTSLVKENPTRVVRRIVH